jgi:hypothetical protein
VTAEQFDVVHYALALVVFWASYFGVRGFFA